MTKEEFTTHIGRLHAAFGLGVTENVKKKLSIWWNELEPLLEDKSSHALKNAVAYCINNMSTLPTLSQLRTELKPFLHEYEKGKGNNSCVECFSGTIYKWKYIDLYKKYHEFSFRCPKCNGDPKFTNQIWNKSYEKLGYKDKPKEEAEDHKNYQMVLDAAGIKNG